MLGKKRAQITVFIIIGIILVVAIVGYFVITNLVVEQPAEQIPGAVLTEQEASIRDYVEACLRPSLLEGLELQRVQGGYIEIPADVDSEMINGQEVPYWLIGDTVNIPTLERMETDLEEYVLSSFKECAGDFSAFKAQGYSIELGTPKLDISLANAVVAELSYPITLRQGDQEVKQEDFIVSVPINMQEVYQTAVDLAAFEGVYNYLEEHTISMISYYSYAGGLKTDFSLPPFAHYEYSLSGCDYESWSKAQVEELLKDNMHANIPYIKFENTEYDEVVRSDPVEQGVFDSFVYNFFTEDKSNIKVDLSYETDWPMEFDILPRAGDTIKPDLFKGIGIKGLAGFCRMKYYFKYDIRYPVLFKVDELESARIVGNSYEADAGYEMQFLIQTFLCGNQKRRCTAAPTFITNLQRLSSFDAETYKYYTELPTSYFCDDSQKISGDITIRAVNEDTSEPIADASVSYFCGSRDNKCLIGDTNDGGVLVSKFPYCVNGEVIVSKDDFESKREMITINNVLANTYTFELIPFKEMELDAKKVYVDYLLENYYMTNGFTTDKCTGEAAAVDLREINPLITDEMMITSNDVSVIFPLETTIKLGRGSYSFELITTQDATIESAVFDGSEYGGADTHASIYTLDVDIDNVKDYNKVTFYMPIEVLTGGTISAEELAEPALQADGSISKTVTVEECDGSSVPVLVTIPKEEVMELLKPKLE